MSAVAEAAVKERGIIFSAPMVLAILEDRKTQTRRVIKHPEYEGCLTGDCPHEQKEQCVACIAEWAKEACPYGKIGDRLYVRESGVLSKPYSPDQKGPWWTFKDGSQSFYPAPGRKEYWPNPNPLTSEWWKEQGQKLTSPIFMPRWASRITLEITNVRVERLHEISEADANQEGCPLPARDQDWTQCRRWYQELWDKINAKPKYVKGAGFGGSTARIESDHSWESNPWVWAISFRRMK